MIKKKSIVCLLIFCVVFFTACNKDTIELEWLKVKSSYTILGTDSSTRDKGYRCCLIWNKTNLLWECTEKNITKEDNSLFFFNPTDVVIESINNLIPWWRFNHKITKNEVVNFYSFNVSNKTTSAEILYVKTTKGYYLLVTERYK